MAVRYLWTSKESSSHLVLASWTFENHNDAKAKAAGFDKMLRKYELKGNHEPADRCNANSNISQPCIPEAFVMICSTASCFLHSVTNNSHDD